MNGIAIEDGITDKAGRGVEVMRMCRDAGKVFCVVPAQERLIGAKHLIGVVDVAIIVIQADLQHTAACQLGAHLQRKLMSGKLLRFKDLHGLA